MPNVKPGGLAPAPGDEDVPYFSERLKARLRKAPAMRGIFIEAPVGYGKTTVAAGYLRSALPKGSLVVWHHCRPDSPPALWRNLGRALQAIDSKTGAELLRLGPPDEDSLRDAGRLLRGLVGAAPTWLVLDDFHHLAALAPAAVWQALLEHECPHLATVLISRPLPENPLPRGKAGFLYLGVDDLRLTPEESRDYAAQAGAALSGQEARELHRRAEGWMFALFLHVRHYREKKSFAPASDFEGLLRAEIWDRLDEAGRDLLQRLSPFEAFSAIQASQLLHVPEPPAALLAALAYTAILRFDDASGLYYPHSLLLEYTRKTVNELPKTAQREILQAAGDWCAANGERKKAIAWYYQLENFEKILALDLSGLPDNRLLDLPDAAPGRPDGPGAPARANGADPPSTEIYADALRKIAARCTRAMKIRHPLSAIQLAFEFFGQGLSEEYAALCGEMAGLVETEVPERERDYLRGELLLMEAFRRYNDIAEMGERIQRASELTGGQTSLVRPDNSWTFGNASVLFMYHREAGRLDAELADLERCCPPYTAMSRGHGSGGPALMRAEALLNRGEAEKAEIFGHRARHEAAGHGQTSLSLGVELFFGRLAVLRGDGMACARALDSLASLAEEYPQKSNRMEADMARSFLAGLLHRPPEAAAWLRDGPPEAFSRRLFTQAIPFAQVCRARCLLLDRKPEVLLGESAAALGLARALHSTPALVYGHLHAAAALAMLGEGREAASELRQALDLALPDALYLPLAEQYDLIGLLLTKALSGKKQAEALTRVEALAEQMRAGRQTAVKEMLAREQFDGGNGLNEQAGKADLKKFHSFAARYDLTEKETEVLSYILRKLSIKEMAENMGISNRGVEKHVTGIKEKTRIERRRHLPRLYADWKM
ncbi:MAG: LuxR C-terminal-related transcriptional regulator [Candidatus Adiutrix sp.]|jgi:LuxR family maltose regulon positive regulatory protein|nr:LuxR C-terminal-related transcriptional regulator [Candidatus Adiutrix sp.]